MKPRLLSQLLPSPDKRGLVLLTGARQTGKTTLVKHLYNNLRYINFDALEYREKASAIPSQQWATTVGSAVIDEAQKLPLVFEKIKYAYDDQQLNFSVLLGSAQILLLKNIRETLAGRISLFELYPCMLCELIADKKVQYPLLSQLLNTNSLQETLSAQPPVLFDEESHIKTWEEHLLRVGGMPHLLSLPDNASAFQWIRDYEQTYLERDLTDLARLHDLQPFRTFQKVSALRSAGLLNYSELARDTSLSVDSARRYLEYLTLSYQIFFLRPYYKNITSTLVKTPKIYWVDLGIWRSLTQCFDTFHGQLFETYVVSECMKWIKSARERAELYFYRTRHGLEIDLIIETPHGVIAAEIKSKPKVDKHDISSLSTLMQLSPEILGGIIIYRGNTIQKLSQTIWAIPSWRLFS